MTRFILSRFRRFAFWIVVLVTAFTFIVAIASFTRVIRVQWDTRTDPKAPVGCRSELSITHGSLHLTSIEYDVSNHGIFGEISQVFNDGRTGVFFQTWVITDHEGFLRRIENSFIFKLVPVIGYFHLQLPALLVPGLFAPWPAIVLWRFIRSRYHRRLRGFAVVTAQ